MYASMQVLLRLTIRPVHLADLMAVAALLAT